MKKTNLAILIIFSLNLFGCCQKRSIYGKYYNSCYFTESPRSILSIEKDRYVMIYPSVIGEKEIGKWEIKNDTLILNLEYEITKDLKDTLKTEKRSTFYIKKRKKIVYTK